MEYFSLYDKYTQAEIDQESAIAGILTDMAGYMWITPKEWTEYYTALQQAGTENVSRFLEHKNLTLGSANPADLGKCFVGGAYCNNRPNWRTVDAIDCALRDRVRLSEVTGQTLAEDDVIHWLAAALKDLVTSRIADVNNRRFILDQTEKWSSENLRHSSITIDTVDALPPLLPLYSCGIQMGFNQSFGRPANLKADNLTLDRFMRSIGINEVESIVALDDFNYAVLSTGFANLQAFGDLMTMAFEQIFKRYFNCKHDKNERNGRRLIVDGQCVESQQILQDLISDETAIGIYNVAADLLPKARDSFWVVAKRDPYSLGQTPRMPLSITPKRKLSTTTQ
jgi:hypothetical protein